MPPSLRCDSHIAGTGIVVVAGIWAVYWVFCCVMCALTSCGCCGARLFAFESWLARSTMMAGGPPPCTMMLRSRDTSCSCASIKLRRSKFMCIEMWHLRHLQSAPQLMRSQPPPLVCCSLRLCTSSYCVLPSPLIGTRHSCEFSASRGGDRTLRVPGMVYARTQPGCHGRVCPVSGLSIAHHNSRAAHK